MSQPHRAALSLSLNLLGRAYLGRAFEHCVFVDLLLLNPPAVITSSLLNEDTCIRIG